jgi:charged multivesicular body protein 4
MCNREDLREQHAIGEEISEAITQSVGNNAVDDTELDEELDELMQEELDNKMMKTGTVPADKIGALPSAPEGVKGKAPVRVEEDDEEEELKRLQAEMAM